MLAATLAPPSVPLWLSGFLIAAAAAFRVNRTAVRRFTPLGDAEVTCDTVFGCVWSEDGLNLTGVEGGTTAPDESAKTCQLFYSRSHETILSLSTPSCLQGVETFQT